METFFTFLERRVDDCSSLLCIGLDPHVSDIPFPTAAAAQDFCLRLVKLTAPYAAAFKPNAAFFELYGPDGWAALKRVIEAIQEESDRLGSTIPVILDAKRGDIASTAEARPRTMQAVDELLCPLVKIVVEMDAPPRSASGQDPMITAVK